jgi:hypothetical protein
MKSAREKMDMVAAYVEVGTYRGAAALCGTTPKTIKRAVLRRDDGDPAPPRVERGHNYDVVADVVAEG